MKLTEDDIVVNNYIPLDEDGEGLTTIHINFNGNYKQAEQLKQQILENQEKLEKIKEWLNNPEIKWLEPIRYSLDEDYDFEIIRKKPDGYIKISEVYHHIRRILGDE